MHIYFGMMGPTQALIIDGTFVMLYRLLGVLFYLYTMVRMPACG